MPLHPPLHQSPPLGSGRKPLGQFTPTDPKSAPLAFTHGQRLQRSIEARAKAYGQGEGSFDIPGSLPVNRSIESSNPNALSPVIQRKDDSVQENALTQVTTDSDVTRAPQRSSNPAIQPQQGSASDDSADIESAVTSSSTDLPASTPDFATHEPNSPESAERISDGEPAASLPTTAAESPASPVSTNPVEENSLAAPASSAPEDLGADLSASDSSTLQRQPIEGDPPPPPSPPTDPPAVQAKDVPSPEPLASAGPDSVPDNSAAEASTETFPTPGSPGVSNSASATSWEPSASTNQEHLESASSDVINETSPQPIQPDATLQAKAASQPEFSSPGPADPTSPIPSEPTDHLAPPLQKSVSAPETSAVETPPISAAPLDRPTPALQESVSATETPVVQPSLAPADPPASTPSKFQELPHPSPSESPAPLSSDLEKSPSQENQIQTYPESSATHKNPELPQPLLPKREPGSPTFTAPLPNLGERFRPALSLAEGERAEPRKRNMFSPEGTVQASPEQSASLTPPAAPSPPETSPPTPASLSPNTSENSHDPSSSPDSLSSPTLSRSPARQPAAPPPETSSAEPPNLQTAPQSWNSLDQLVTGPNQDDSQDWSSQFDLQTPISEELINPYNPPPIQLSPENPSPAHSPNSTPDNTTDESSTASQKPDPATLETLAQATLLWIQDDLTLAQTRQRTTTHHPLPWLTQPLLPPDQTYKKSTQNNNLKQYLQTLPHPTEPHLYSLVLELKQRLQVRLERERDRTSYPTYR